MAAMGKRRGTRYGVWCLACASGLFWSGVVCAQKPAEGDGEFLDQVRRREQVASQQVEADLRAMLRSAQHLAAKQPRKAIDELQKALDILEADTLLPAQRRTALRKMFQDRLRVTKADLDATESRTVVKDKPQPQEVQRTEEQRHRADIEKLRSGLARVKELQNEHRYDDASREAAALTQQLPPSPATQALERTARGADLIANDRKFQKERERNLAGAFRDVDRATVLPGTEMEFPKDWKERTKGRTSGVELTAKEKSILKALRSPITVNFKNSRLEDAIEFLKDYVDVPIILYQDALKDVEASYDSPVTLKAKGITVRTALRKILADLGMTYIIKDETIQIVSAQRAKELMVTRRYYIGDLVGNPGLFGAVGGVQPILPGFLNEQAQLQAQGALVAQTVKQIIEMIENSVDTSSWRTNGGNGTISFHAPSMSLVIRQSAEVHALLGNGNILK